MDQSILYTSLGSSHPGCDALDQNNKTQLLGSFDFQDIGGQGPVRIHCALGGAGTHQIC